MLKDYQLFLALIAHVSGRLKCAGGIVSVSIKTFVSQIGYSNQSTVSKLFYFGGIVSVVRVVAFPSTT